MKNENSIRNGNGNQAHFSLRTLARLWPNRVHESSWLKDLSCYLGLHRWHELKFGYSPLAQAARFCRWCSKIEDL